MKRTPKPPRPPGRVRCPICGNDSRFAAYIATVKVHHLAQHPSGRWRRTSAESRRHDTSLPLLLVCESCAHPTGQPSLAALSAIKLGRRRR